MAKADHMLAILWLLTSRRQLTARELPEELEIQVRTVYRCIDALCASGVPIIAEGACAERIGVLIDYQSGDSGPVTTQTLEPYGLVHWKSKWYVVGHCRLREEIRSFRRPIPRRRIFSCRMAAGYELWSRPGSRSR